MKSFGRITWLVLADANRQRKKADRYGSAGGYQAETKSAGTQVAGIREMITRDTTSVATCREASGEPSTTERGGGVQEPSARGSRYMDAATFADGGCERIGKVGSAIEDVGGNSGAVHVLAGRALS